jgi:hypothetical protein
MAEYCFHCLSVATDGDPLQSEDWLVLVTRDGEYLGVVCSGCVVDEDLAVVELEELYRVAA